MLLPRENNWAQDFIKDAQNEGQESDNPNNSMCDLEYLAVHGRTGPDDGHIRRNRFIVMKLRLTTHMEENLVFVLDEPSRTSNAEPYCACHHHEVDGTQSELERRHSAAELKNLLAGWIETQRKTAE